MHSSILHWLGGICLLAMSSCATTGDVDSLRRALLAIDQKVDQHHLALRAELNAGWASALCKDEVQQFLSDIRSACQPGRLCADSRIQSVALDMEAQHHGRFLTLMASQRHTTVFFGMRGAPRLVELHRVNLQRIAEKPWLPTTRFLVMSNTGNTEGMNKAALERAENAATQRGEQVINEILRVYPDIVAPSQSSDAGGPPRHRTNERVIHVVFNFEPKRDEVLSIADRPPPGGSFKHSVWIFRVDC